MLRERPYRLPQHSPRRSPLLIVALVALALALLAADQAGMLGSLRARADSLLSPALVALRGAGQTTASLGQRLGDRAALEAELEVLRAENGELKAAIIRTQALELENERLRQQLRIEQEHPWRLVGADVGSVTPDTGRRVVLLAVGSEQGVRSGMAVIAREGSSPPALIGVVEEVGPESASVLLITDFSSALSAQVYQPSGPAGGIVQGQWQRGSRLLLDAIDRGATLAPGDVVVTAGLTARVATGLPRAAIPADVPIGTVDAVRTTARGQVADLRPYVDPDRVRYAWVILGGE